MNNLSLFFAAGVALIIFPAAAQHQDIRFWSTAMEACSVEGQGGYGTYEACVEQTYDDLINFRGYRVESVDLFGTLPGLVEWVRLDCFGKLKDQWCDVNNN